MKRSLLELLVCPDCHLGLALASTDDARDDPEILEGSLACAGCGAVYPIRRGVPRFVAPETMQETALTAAAFGWEWQAFARIDPHHEQQFLDWIAPVGPSDFKGRLVLEGGCGKGRHTRLVAGYGVRAVIGVDLSEAVDVAFANTRQMPNVLIVQADLRRLPLKPLSVDHVFSVGVLHHLPEPNEGFQSLARATRPGGALSVWVYGAENNQWIARVVSPLRRVFTSRIPPRALHALSWLLSVPLWVALRLLYRPAGRRQLAWMRRFLFYYPYLGYISKFPFREIHHIVHDHLAAPVAHYMTRDDVAGMYRAAGMHDARFEWHNRNSWRGLGRKGV